MAKKAILVLEDGAVYEGYAFGAEGIANGEVVFNTSMTGYQEMLTDPSYAGQIVVPTYPLIGNYGVNAFDYESDRIQVAGFVVREECHLPSHWQSQRTLHEYLVSQDIPGMAGLDTRALTRRLRSAGVMMGTITADESLGEALERMKHLPRYDDIDYVKQVTAKHIYEYQPSERNPRCWPHIVVLDCGVKFNILRILKGLGCSVTVAPVTTSAQDILALKPDGIVLSPGPGDPALPYLEETVRDLVGARPIFGICLGHQVLGRIFGGSTFKLKFGHRGANHPVRELATGRAYITSQNHGYAVDPRGLRPEVEVTHINLNDGTVEGLRHKELPIFSIQYHSEASPGPQDTRSSFERFLDLVRG